MRYHVQLFRGMKHYGIFRGKTQIILVICIIQFLWTTDKLIIEAGTIDINHMKRARILYGMVLKFYQA